MNVKSTIKNAKLGQRPTQHLRRRGYTLLELVISAGAATILLGGLMSTIVVANRAWSPDLKPAIKTEASGLTRQLGIDLKSALYFTERTPDAITFAVPDRDSDGQPEMLRYAWSGTAGDPLTVALNGGSAQVVVADVQTFNMDFLTRTVTAPVIPTSGQNQTIVFLSEEAAGKNGSADQNSLPEEDQQRITAIESWGFTVSTLSKDASDADWASAVDQAAAFYVPGSVQDENVSKRLYHANVGVVFETSSLRDDSGYGAQYELATRKDIYVENTHHFITSQFSPGLVRVVNNVQDQMKLKPGFGPDLEVLARGTSQIYTAALAVMEEGARTFRNDTAAGRRVLLPWGTNSTPFDQLTDDALTIMERSITWAAKLDDSPSRRRVLYFVEDIYAHDAREFDRKIMFEAAGLEVRFLNRTSSADVIADELANSSAVYLSAYISTDNLLSAVNDSSVGIMTEGLDWTVPLGFSTGVGKANVTTVNIKEQDHEILNGISGNSVTVTTGNVSLVVPGGDLANGALTILEAPSSGKGSADPAIVVIEKGNQRVDDTDAPGRRTFIPYYNTPRPDLTEDGYRLIQQAMNWTTQKPEPVVVESAQSQAFRSFLNGLFGQ